MRTSINQFMAPALSLQEVAATARALDVDGVGVFRPCLAELGAPAVSRFLGAAGRRATSVCVAFGLTGPDAAARRVRLDDARAAVRDAAALGVPLVVVAGGPGARSTAAVLREFEEQLAILADDANRQGVRLLLEPLHPALTHLSVLTSLREAGRIAARHPNVGVVLDSWHVWSEPDLVETVGKHAERIDVVHLADWRPGPFTERRALPGAGVMDLAALGDALRDVLADAWWELEVIDEDAADRDAQRQLLRGAVHAARAGGLFSEGTCASPSSAARPAARAH